MGGYPSFIVVTLCALVTLTNGKLVLVWKDDFNWNGGVNTEKWAFDVGGGGWGNNEAEFYTDNRKKNARCKLFPDSDNGRLIIEARMENWTNYQYTSARMKSKASWTYGRLQVRAKLPSGRGLWPAIWMLPKSQVYGSAYWPENGEMDLMEQVGYDPLRIHSSVQTEAFNSLINMEPTNSIIVNDSVSNFKVYTLDWYETQLEMFVGDEANPTEERILVWYKTGNWTQWPFDQPFFVLLNVAVGGNWGGAEGIDPTIFPQKMEIDWVHYYQRR